MTDRAADLFDDVTFAAPPAWRRRIILAFVEPSAPEKPNPANAVFVREPLPEGETVHSLSEKHLLDVRALPNFDLLERRVLDRDGVTCVELAYEWRNEGGPVEQTSTFMVTENEDGATITNATATCAKEDAAAMRPIFAALVASVRPARARTVSGIDLTKAPDAEPHLSEFPMPFIPMPGTRGRE